MKKLEDYRFEVCANSLESCLNAQSGGAHRVELCAGIPEGGTTPSFGEVFQARRLLNDTLLHVIIRPRGGDFLYSSLEVEQMECDIQMCRKLGVDGVVFGCLTADGGIDRPICERLLYAAEGMNTTFHRAFDHCRDASAALETLVELGFDRVLTSGQQPTAELGIPLLAELEKQSDGRIILMAGCGVNEGNIAAIARATGIHEFHFSARERVASRMRHTNPAVYMGIEGADENGIDVTTEHRVRATIDALYSSVG